MPGRAAMGASPTALPTQGEAGTAGGAAWLFLPLPSQSELQNLSESPPTLPKLIQINQFRTVIQISRSNHCPLNCPNPNPNQILPYLQECSIPRPWARSMPRCHFIQPTGLLTHPWGAMWAMALCTRLGLQKVARGPIPACRGWMRTVQGLHSLILASRAVVVQGLHSLITAGWGWHRVSRA